MALNGASVNGHGKNAGCITDDWNANIAYTEKKKQNQKYYNCNAIGSDEVGTGDYFGPIVVTASYVDIKDKFNYIISNNVAIIYTKAITAKLKALLSLSFLILHL